MCELATIGLVASLASTAIGGYAQYQQGKAQQAASRQAAKYNSQIAANEAATQRALAQQELQKGAEERSRVLRAGKAKQGEMAALMGGSGFTLDSGTNLGLLAQSASEIQQDAAKVDQNANMNAWQRMAGATNAQNEGDFAVWQGNQGGGGGGLLAAGTILGGIGQGIGAYNSWNSTKTPAAKVGGKPPVSGSTISRGYVSKTQRSL